ncbi:hypothetical protein GN958_ATG06191 [Phytophthora infestans]|uniref:Uncharacterized protein n=1 Tax=Phytophthora infestans TaxID=4787 RepID=A0A8S9V2G9_PHYIN|nr:hypothetical protein GN958_ATG06191 [Phytophthora infestans]
MDASGAQLGGISSQDEHEFSLIVEILKELSRLRLGQHITLYMNRTSLPFASFRSSHRADALSRLPSADDFDTDAVYSFVEDEDFFSLTYERLADEDSFSLTYDRLALQQQDQELSDARRRYPYYF